MSAMARPVSMSVTSAGGLAWLRPAPASSFYPATILTILQQGTLTLARDNALGFGTLIAQGSVVNYAGGVNIGNQINLQSNTTQLQVLNWTAVQSGSISETGGSRPLEKIGDGMLILAANNTYTGT